MAQLPAYKRTFPADYDLSQVEHNAFTAVQPLLVDPFLHGRLLVGVILTGGADTVINHGLGRVPQGWVLCDSNANSNVWRNAASTTTTLTLRASNTVTVNLRVF